MSRNKPGRTRIRLAQMLTKALGVPVSPDLIWDNNYPEARLLGLARWGCYVPNGNLVIHVCSWDTMGNCVSSGFDFLKPDRNEFYIEVCAKGEN